MELKESMQQREGGFIKKTVVEKPSQFVGRKADIRFRIHHQVFDLYDSVADNAKMISLIFSILMRIWEALPDDIKSNIDEADVQLIDYAFTKFKNIRTRADVQFEKEGVGLIDKLMTRQDKIGKIVSY